MKIFDIVCLLIIVLYTWKGVRKGVIRTGVSLIGFLATLVISYVLKTPLANFLIDKMPFFDFIGSFKGLTAMNIFFYNIISFIIIFVILYCVLSVLINLAGLVEKLLEKTIVLAIPSKVLGGILGFIEGILVSFIISFVAIHIPFTTEYVAESKVAVVTLERSPLISRMAINTSLAMEDIAKIVKDTKDSPNREDANFKVLHTIIYYKLIDNNKLQELINNEKIRFSSTVII